MNYRKWIVALGLLVLTGVLWAQTGLGSIQGTVKDPTDAVVPNAAVVAVHVETGSTFKTTSNATGFFILPAMQIGKYHVSAESPGMEKWEADLELEAGQDAVIAPTLKVGGTASQVTVAGDVTPLVTTNSPTLASVADRDRIDQLPLNGRFFQNLLIVTTPGLESGLVRREQRASLRSAGRDHAVRPGRRVASRIWTRASCRTGRRGSIRSRNTVWK